MYWLESKQEISDFNSLGFSLFREWKIKHVNPYVGKLRLSPCIKEKLGRLTLFIRFMGGSRISKDETEKRKLSHKIFISSGKTNFG